MKLVMGRETRKQDSNNPMQENHSFQMEELQTVLSIETI